MKFIIAESAGFCFGVKKAVETVEKNIGLYPHLYTYGEIIHNPQVVEDFKNRGVRAVNSPDEAEKDSAVIIRSHGASTKEIDAFIKKGIKIIDATCPFVKRIQKIVQTALQNGDFIVIIGERSHPEVVGINGHCEDSGCVINSPGEVISLPDTEKDVTVVAQTTTQKELYDEICRELEKKYGKIKKYDTICDATVTRQKEARELAKKADVTVVIGGKQSSNTAKLYKICSEYSKRTYAAERPSDVSAIKIYKNDIIGITAGASTPERLIKEVVERMSENEVFAENLSFEEEMNKTLVNIRPGQVIKGKVIYVKENEVTVDIGYKADGIVTKEELTASGEEDPRDLFKEGDEIDVEVLKKNDGNGNVILSRKRIVERLKADEKLASISNGEVFEVTVKEVVKGGLLADFDGIRVFIPRSQIRMNGYAHDVDRYVGQTLRVRALDIDYKHRKVVATHSAVIAEEKQAAFDTAWSKLEEGATVKGVVRRLTDFGAFVDVGGIDGLIHIGDLAWYRINKPSDILRAGDEIEVVILSMDKETGRISLGYKQLQPKPWDDAVERYPVDSIVKGRVVRITSFGAFVNLEPGIDGLVHISEVSNRFVQKVDEAVCVGDEIEALVLSVDPEEKRVSLSIKALLDEQEAEEEEVAEEAAEAAEETEN